MTRRNSLSALDWIQANRVQKIAESHIKIIKAGFADPFLLPVTPGFCQAFRQRGAGDILRDVYQSLTADPHSLANLDQERSAWANLGSIGM